MGKRFVMPVEEMVSAFWECPTGKRMAVSADRGSQLNYVAFMYNE
jgi:hypothetical protein